MKIFLNASNEVDVAGMKDDSTVYEFFSAIDRFAAANPLPCAICRHNCCDRRFNIEMDYVSAIRLSRGDLHQYIRDVLTVVYPQHVAIQILLSGATKRCPYLGPGNRCSVYADRPATCRSYTCLPRSLRYDIVDRSIVAALHYALVAAYFEGLVDNADEPDELRDLVAEPLAWLRNNPAYGKPECDMIRVRDCVRFDMEGANISAQEMQVYVEIVAMGGALSRE
jgi:Fe-S-cluster containining protein